MNGTQRVNIKKYPVLAVALRLKIQNGRKKMTEELSETTKRKIPTVKEALILLVGILIGIIISCGVLAMRRDLFAFLF